MTGNTPFIFATIVLDGLAGLSGGLLSERWLIRHQAALIGFAAGAILGAVFLDVLPEALGEIGPNALAWSFSGFVALAVVEWFVGDHHHEHRSSSTLPATLLMSDALHNIGDGAAIAAAFLVSTKVGFAVGVAVIAHEIPQEVGDYAVLRAANWPRAQALLGLAVVQLTALIGAIGVLLAVRQLGRATPIVLSIAAGTFLYIGATDLLPNVRSGKTLSDRAERIIGFVSGIVLIAVVSVLAPQLTM